MSTPQQNKRKPKTKSVKNTRKPQSNRPSSATQSFNFDKPLESGGEAIGRKLGAFAGKLLGKITGVGDYSVDLPSGGTQISPTVVPEFIHSDNARETRIRHREYVGDVYASSTAGAFTNKAYVINPGSLSTFPWLAGIARNFDQWQPHGMAVIFKSLSSTYSATQSLGTVIIATDYDVTDNDYENKIEMENSQFAVSGSAATCLMHPIECAPDERMTRVLLVRDDNTVDTDRWFDLGKLQVASAGCLANQLLGELWITYDISLFKPQLKATVNPALIRFCSFKAAGAVSNSSLFNGTITSDPKSTFFVSPGNFNLVFPRNALGTFYQITIAIPLAAGQTPNPIDAVTSFSNGAKQGPIIFSLTTNTSNNPYPGTLYIITSVDLTNLEWNTALRPTVTITLSNVLGPATAPYGSKTTIHEINTLTSNGF